MARGGGVKGDAGTVAGKPNNPRIAEEVSRDLGLPVINDVVPVAGAPMLLHCMLNNTVYVIGRTDDDISSADGVLSKLRSR
jgi:hypothetical protein